MKKLPGILMRSQLSIFEGKVFYVHYGKRYWVRDGEWFKRNGFNWPNDVIDVSPEILYSSSNGGIAPVFKKANLDNVATRSSMDMREITASTISGTGLEFGAGASPFPVPLDCNVLFADIFSYDSLKEHLYPGQDSYNLVRPDYVTDIKTLKGISDESLNFIVTCHVIEHTNNPIAALDSCHRALKPGGALVLVVPDMTKTFDSGRELTALDHLIEDYRSPSMDRDLLHYKEFYDKSLPITSNVNKMEFIIQKQKEGGDIHYHTWTYKSFEELILWHADKNKWFIEFSHPTLSGSENIEFYFQLIKQ
jgi:SAM-dependent methyltransferase